MAALNTLVRVMSRDSGSDALGAPSGAWTVQICEVFADILHPSGREMIGSGGELAIVKASIRMHRRDDVLEGMRVYKGSVGYDIQAILPDDRNRLYMMLVCQKVVG
jgi:SPP1 family predicted phage head-tail adaptor